MRMKPLVLWSVAAALAVGASSAAVSAATSGTGHDVLSPADVARDLAGGAPVVPATSPLPASPAPAGSGQPLDTPGGVVVASCEATGPTLLRWAPKSGYRVGHTSASPAAAGIVFETDGDNDVTVTITCVDGRAHAEFTVGKDDHGGGGGDDNGGHG